MVGGVQVVLLDAQLVTHKVSAAAAWMAFIFTKITV